MSVYGENGYIEDDYNGGQGVPSIPEIISTAIDAALGPLTATFQFGVSSFNAATNNVVTAPAVLTVGAVWNVDGVTVLVNAPFSAPGVRVFNCVNGGRVVFADGMVMEIDPRWWGLAQGATAAVNDAAIRAARDSITTRGTVRFPPGIFNVSAYTPINRSYIRFVGAGDFSSTLYAVPGSGDVTGIDGYAQPGFSSASSYLDETAHIGISVYRTDSQSAAVPVDGERRPTHPASGSKGFLHRYSANADISFEGVGNPIDYYENQTTGCRVNIVSKRGALSGDNNATQYVGVLSDCETNAGTSAQVSSNGSSYKRLKQYTDPAFPGESWGLIVVGSDLRDHFWESIETGNTTHAVDYYANGSAIQAWDTHFSRMVCDGWKSTGIRFRALPAGSRFNIVDGYSAPAAGVANAVAVDIDLCSGVNIGRGFEAKGAASFATATGVRLRNGSARCDIRAACTGTNVGVLVDNSPFNMIAPQVEALSGQSCTAAIRLQNGASRNYIGGFVISDDTGAQTVVIGVDIDATSSYNTVDGGVIAAIGGVATNIRISGASVTASGTTNHNKVTDAAIPPV